METTQTSTDTVTNSQPSGAEPQTTVTTTDQEPTEPIVINSSTNSNSNSIPNSNPLFQEFIQPDEERVAEIDANTALETMKDLADELFTEDEEKDVIEKDWQTWAEADSEEDHPLAKAWATVPKTYEALDAEKAKPLIKKAAKAVLNYFNHNEVGETFTAEQSEPLVNYLRETTDDKRKFGNTEGEVEAIVGFNEKTNEFLIQWKVTKEPAAAIAHLDWCFVYASLCSLDNGRGIHGKAMKAAYRAWRCARVCTGLEPTRIKNGKAYLEYPSKPLRGFVHSLLNLRRINGNYLIPQLAIPTFERLAQEGQEEANRIKELITQKQKIPDKDHKFMRQYRRIKAVVLTARKLYDYDPAHPYETLPAPKRVLETRTTFEFDPQNPDIQFDDQTQAQETAPAQPAPAQPTPAQPAPAQPQAQPAQN